VISLSSRSVEDYLKALFLLSQNGKAVSTTEIAEHFKIAPASVTEMLKKLAEKQYIEYSPYHGAYLTTKGSRIAEKITRKHRLLERFLNDVLKLKKDEVHVQACEMEHALSDEAEESLCRFLDHPDHCPDDSQTIPACDLPFTTCEECVDLHEKNLEENGKREQIPVPINRLKDGERGKISFIRGGHKALKRLSDMGLTPDTEITVVKSAPFHGPTEILVRGSRLAIGRGMTETIFVEAERV
jgi:DtxR family transcriptional regulator, Mn-dependent transcriptional regulator